MVSSCFLGVGEGRSFFNGIGRPRVKVEPGSAPGFAMFESELPPESAGPPRHIHADYDEAFYVLDGEMRFWVGGDQQDCGPGSVVFVPRNVVHRFANESDRPSRVLVVLTPEGLRLVEGLGSAGSDAAATQRLWSEHRSRVVNTPEPPRREMGPLPAAARLGCGRDLPDRNRVEEFEDAGDLCPDRLTLPGRHPDT